MNFKNLLLSGLTTAGLFGLAYISYAHPEVWRHMVLVTTTLLIWLILYGIYQIVNGEPVFGGKDD